VGGNGIGPRGEISGLNGGALPSFKIFQFLNKLNKLANGAVAVSFAKKAINSSIDMTTEEAMEFSSRLYGEVYRTWDAKEGITAYLEKRKPEFIGK